jgi:hypothetical protein
MHWLDLLKNKVELLGRRQVEADTSMSKTTLSLVLNDKYPGNLSNIESQVIIAYTNTTVACPVLGDIAVKRCNTEQIKGFSPSNPQRIKLYKACATCPHKKANQ